MSWRYLAQRLNGDGTGTFLDTNLPLSNVSITDVLSGPGRLSGVIPLEYQNLKGEDGRPILEPWNTAIYAESDGQIRAGSLLRTRDADGPSLSLDAAGFSGYAEGMPYTDSYFGVQQDPLDMARKIWDHLQDQPRGNLGLILDSTTSPKRIGTTLTQVQFDSQAGPVSFESGPYKLNWWQTSNLGDEFDSLAKSTPFDYHEEHTWNADRSDIEHRLRLGYPRLGRRRHDLRFIVGQNINILPTVTVDGDSYANGVMVLGAGEGRDMVRSDVVSHDDGRLRRIAVVTDKSIKSKSRAVALARSELGARQVLEGKLSNITIRQHPHAPIGSWNVGDEVFVEASVGWDKLDVWCRILSATINPEAADVAVLTIKRKLRMTDAVRQLARELGRLSRQVNAISSQPQLAHSSIEGGAVQSYDDTGSLGVIIGTQYDGAQTIVQTNGVAPPTPTVPAVTPVIRALLVHWDGEWTDALVAPSDFSRVEVHMSPTAGFEPDLATTLKATFESPRGGEVLVKADPTAAQYVKLLARNQSGAASAVSAQASGTSLQVSEAIEPGSLVASDLVAANSITAALLEAALVLVSEIIAGDPAGMHAAMDDNGFHVYATDPLDGNVYEVARFGTGTDDFFGITDAAGKVLAGIDDAGRIACQSLEVTGDIMTNGMSLDQLLSTGGGVIAQVYDPFTDGIAAPDAQSAEIGYYDLGFEMLPGRTYEVLTSQSVLRGSVAGNLLQARLRIAVNATPNTSSAQIALCTTPQVYGANTAHITSPMLAVLRGSDYVTDADVAAGTNTVRILISHQAVQAGGASLGTCMWHAPNTYPQSMIIRDSGPEVDSNPVQNHSTAAVPVVVATKKTYTSTWDATWTQSFRGNGTLRSDTTDAVQGSTASNGDGKALIGFPSVTPTLSGSVVKKVEVYLYASHWYNNSGGTAIIGTHSNAAAPGSYSGGLNADRIRSASWPKPGGRWVTLPSAAWDEFRTGASRGIIVGPSGGTNQLYYGRFNGASAGSNKPKLRITYTR